MANLAQNSHLRCLPLPRSFWTLPTVSVLAADNTNAVGDAPTVLASV